MSFIADIAANVASNAPNGFEAAMFLGTAGIIINAPVVVLFIVAKIIDRR